MKVLGMDPAEVMTHPDFPLPTYRFNKDNRNHDIANRGSALILASYTKWVDQMVIYAATRKGQSELRSNALTFVAQHELGDEKLDYGDEANIKTLPYVNYEKFVIYNIKDVLLQLGIERKTNDIENLYLRSYSNGVSYDKVFKQTVALRSRQLYEYLLQGNIVGNNINSLYVNFDDPKDDDDDEEGFDGALVGDPLLNMKTGIRLFGSRSNRVYNNVIDLDFTAMYPHIIMAFNIERNTMIGKLSITDIDKDVYPHKFVSPTKEKKTRKSKKKAEELNDNYDSGKDFVDNYMTGDTLSIGTKWFDLPDVEEVDKLFKERKNIKDTKTLRWDSGPKYFLEKLNIFGGRKDD